MRSLRGHLPPARALSRPLGSLPGTNLLHLAISLPFRNQASLSNFLQQLHDPTSPAFHHFLDSRQFSAAFGPTEKDYQAVIDFAQANHLTITATHANHELLEVNASVSDIERAFRLKLHVFQHPRERRTFYAPDSEPSVDSDIPVLFIAGLNNFQIPHPASLHVGSVAPGPNATPNAGSYYGLYVGQDFRSAYVPGVTNTGAGQSVALVEFDSYYPSDITDYLNMPATGLAGTSVTLSNVVLGLTGTPGGGNVEAALDIDMAISIAPKLSTIYVYEGTNDATAPDLVLNRILSDNLSRQISCSWSGFDDAAVENDFLQFDAQGQSFFQASGDGGAYTAPLGGNPVAPPCDSPNITVVGGTTLNTTGPSGSWVSEITWSWFPGQPAAGSGGISATWSLPTWQQGIDMSTNQGSTTYRNLPDVAMVANDIFLYASDGYYYSVGGTSAATPLWAGLMALINQQRAAQSQPPEGFVNPALYALGKGPSYGTCFHDITVGNNTNFSSPEDYYAYPGYDLCTGWGTPIGAGLIHALAPEPLQITPAQGFVSSGSYGGPFSVTSQSFTLTNAATTSFGWSVGNAPAWLSVSASGGTLASGGTATILNVGLTAAASHLTVGAYTNTLWLTNLNDGVAQSRQFVLNVSMATPTLTWADPAPITYGTALTASQLQATASVPGNFSYDPASGSILAAGANALAVIFTPTDAVDYNSVTTGATLIVSPAPLTVTAANATRLFGQPNPVFQGALAGLQNGDNLKAAYICGATSTSPVGAYPIVPSLVGPANLEANYSVDLIDGMLTVNQATVVLTWTNPAPIIFGSALSATQLNATANLPGTFAYNPAIDTVLGQGTNTLAVVFTPDDAIDYASATDTVSLLVNAPPIQDTGDTPLLPTWATAGLAIALGTVGARFLARRSSPVNGQRL